MSQGSSMKISLHTPDTIYSPRHLPSWFFLAGAAGAVNGFAFISCQQFVSHVTGTATRIGLEWNRIDLAGEYAVVVLSFVLGAIASVVWIQARAQRGKRPHWATPLLCVALILAGTGLAGHNELFGLFANQVASDPPPVILLSILGFAMGLQNATVASTTGLAVRTTHLSGPATDFGIHLGTACFATGPERTAALQGATLRGGKIVAFIIGAGLSVPLTDLYGYMALIAPAILVTFAALLSFLPSWSPIDYPFLAPEVAAKSDS
jgi:uncharacterized membrane protein YoaK (UPF0700 family)